MSGHPPHCAGCDGSGWAPGPPIVEHVSGRRAEYATLVPCEYPWWRDDPTWHADADPVPPSHPTAVAAVERGHAQGKADIDRLKAGWQRADEVIPWLHQTDDGGWGITDRD